MIGVTGEAKPQLLDRPGYHAAARYSPAGEAKPEFKPGDTIVAINKTPVQTYREVDHLLAQLANQSIEVNVHRASGKSDGEKQNGEEMVVKVEPAALRDFGLIMPLGPITAVQKNSPAEEAGVQPGDQIFSIDGKDVGDPMALEQRLQQTAGKAVVFGLDADRTEM